MTESLRAPADFDRLASFHGARWDHNGHYHGFRGEPPWRFAWAVSALICERADTTLYLHTAPPLERECGDAERLSEAVLPQRGIPRIPARSGA
ncbi:MAG: hypothetical protein ICV87_01290 [Gemmatimonadetes bacterium]|nr:hypothetical protein [Gemmatimonadota bacterium]